MRIALVLAASTGGVGAHVRDLAAALTARGDEVVVVCAPRETAERFGFTAAGARCVPVAIGTTARDAARPGELWRLRRAVVAARVDLVHVHGVRAAAFARIALAGRGTALVVTLHNAVSQPTPSQGSAVYVRRAARLSARLAAWPAAALERFAVAGARIVLGASGDLVVRARELGAADARFGPVAAPALPAPTTSRARARAALGVRDGQTLVLAIGRLAGQKDYPLLLDALAASTTRDLVVLIAGEGPLRSRLQADIDRRVLPARLLGPRADVADLFAAADVFALSSRWEARPLVVQEAMRAGVPVLATAVGGVPDLVGAGAVLVAPGDPRAYARALDALAADPAERARLAAAGLEQAAEWPDAAACLAIVEACYADAVSRSGSRAASSR